MSAYEDIGLSHVSLNESTYGKMQFATPIGASEAFVVAVKVRAAGEAATSYPKIFQIGTATASSGSGGLQLVANGPNGRVYLYHYAGGSTKQAWADAAGTIPKLADGEDHICICSCPAGAGTLQIWADDESRSAATVSVTSGFASPLLGFTLNGSVANVDWTNPPTETGIWNISWIAVYSTLDVNGRAALFAGANPLTVGTLRSGDSFWDFDGDGNEYNGGTPFTFTGAPSFVQPAYPDTLEVTESYLSLDSTQYAQAPIGATRLATFGGNPSTYGIIPTWTASNWEIEFDVVFSTTTTNWGYLLDCASDGLNRFYLYVASGTYMLDWSAGSVVCYFDGNSITRGAQAVVRDGAVHHIKLVGTGFLAKIGTILSRLNNIEHSEDALFNIRLTDLGTPSNSRFYPMDESSAVSSFADTSANAQHGTWYNRVAGDVKTVYPSAIKPTESVWWARKFRITGGTSDPYLATLGAVISGSSGAIVAWYNSTGKESIMRINNASNVGEYANTVVNDGQDHIVIINIKSGAFDIWIDGAVKITGITGTALAYAMNMLTINALWNGTAASRKGSQRVYWEYLYNTLSPADITALMQGEHPASVGNVRQGYNLAGDGDEVNGGPALTLYNSPRFVVPNRVGLTRPLVSRLVSSLTSKQIVSR